MEKSILVGVFEPGIKDFEIKAALDELKLLTESAGGEVVDVVFQRRKSPDKKYHLGKGKVEEIKNNADFKNIDLIVFCNSLNNVQQRNLEDFFNIKVLDRTRLILDIFATRARSLEGKLQVELAQLLYLLPRLTGWGIELSRLGGGIGTRGPGETKLEVDRRTIKKRISSIKKKLLKVKRNRDVQRKKRKLYPVPVISLVGYTSAGKSTLFKSLTDEDVLISNTLFSTLDPLLRRVELNEIKEGFYFLLSDTVGFIRDMPEELFESFKATLEEMVQSDLILHIIDVSNPDFRRQEYEVKKVLKKMGIQEEKIIKVFNKIDLLNDSFNNDVSESFLSRSKDGELHISALKKTGIKNLKKAIFDRYFNDYERYEIRIPQKKLNLESIKNWAIIVSRNNHRDLVDLEVLCSRGKMLKFKEKYGGYIT